MTEALATELLELIVDSVASDATQDRTEDLLSLSLSCKALVPCAQKHIFHDVMLYPPVKDHRGKWSPPPKYLKRYERTASFLHTVARRPHLAGHVHALTCTFTAQWLDTDSTLHSNVLQAFERMAKIRRLILAYEDPHTRDPRLDFGLWSIASSKWMVGITSTLRAPQLEELAIHRLTNCPGEVILRSSHLRRLKLVNTKVQSVLSL